MNTREKMIELEESAEHDKRMRAIAQNGNSGEHYTTSSTLEQEFFAGFNKPVKNIEVVHEVVAPTSKANESFDEVINSTLIDLKELLIVKGKEYRRNNNVYHNFDQGSKIKGIIPEKVLDGFLLKHEVSIADITDDIEKGILPSKEKVEEKFNDNIIYLLIKKAMILNRINNNN